VFNGAEGGWYTYDLGQHKLITKTDRYYAIENGDGGYWKLKMKSYYDEQGTAARMPVRVDEAFAAVSRGGPLLNISGVVTLDVSLGRGQVSNAHVTPRAACRAFELLHPRRRA
jgi:hypothetical protein